MDELFTGLCLTHYRLSRVYPVLPLSDLQFMEGTDRGGKIWSQIAQLRAPREGSFPHLGEVSRGRQHGQTQTPCQHSTLLGKGSYFVQGYVPASTIETQSLFPSI